MFRRVPLSIIRSFALYTQQWYMCWQLASRIRTESVPSWSCSQTVSKPVWHIPLLCVQWKTPDDGQRTCPKHVEFYSKNKLEVLLHLVGFIIRSWGFFTLSPCFSQNHFKTNYFQLNSFDRKKYCNPYHHQHEQGTRYFLACFIHMVLGSPSRPTFLLQLECIHILA